MTDRICIPKIDKNELDKFVRETKVKHQTITSWFGWTELDTDGLCIPVKYKGELLFLKRSYHVWNHPVAWDLQLEVVDVDDDPVKEIPKLTFSTYFDIEKCVNDEKNWCYENKKDLTYDLYMWMWDIAEESWGAIYSTDQLMTKRLANILHQLFLNEIKHQIGRFRYDIDELINKYNNGEIIAEV